MLWQLKVFQEHPIHTKKIQSNLRRMEQLPRPAPIVNELAPPRKNSLELISNPATNNITIAANSPIFLIVSSRITSGSTLNNGNPPNA
jgi:hypothetical protein